MTQPAQIQTLTPDPQKFKPLPKPNVIRADNTYNLIGLWVPFGDLAPNNTTINATVNIPPGYHIAIANATELNPSDDNPKVGAAVFDTQSVQLDTDGGIVRVVFTQNWGHPLPFGIMLVLG
jgi:hypothetical protein